MAKSNKKSKTPKSKTPADKTVGKPGTTTDLSSSVITLVSGAKNPASKKSDRFRRFALMTNGMTVGEWYAVCRNNPEITGRAHAKLATKARDKGFIKLTAGK
jgi:hypothetical protein